MILRFFIRFEVHGRENLVNLPSGVIFAPNHSSELDPILVPAAMSFASKHLGMFYTSREQSFYKNSGWRKMFYGGTFFKIWGAYPVVVGSHNYDTSLRNHTEILKRGHPVCIFPEGKKTVTGQLGESKGGVGYLSYMTKAPIVPVAIKGVYQLSFSDFLLRKRKVHFYFGKPLYPKDIFANEKHITISHERDDCRLAAARVMGEVRTLLTS
jgi:1-acyl-sn-glycerol-3-phosphate acyltransferase